MSNREFIAASLWLPRPWVVARVKLGVGNGRACGCVVMFVPDIT